MDGEVTAMDDMAKDMIPRKAVEYCLRKETVSTNPEAYKAHKKFIEYMNDPEISQFGHWMHANGYNCALVSVAVDLDKIPSAQPTLYGYDINTLALVAEIMRKNNVNPEEALQIFRNDQRIAEMIRNEFHEIVRKQIEQIFPDAYVHIKDGNLP